MASRPYRAGQGADWSFYFLFGAVAFVVLYALARYALPFVRDTRLATLLAAVPLLAAWSTALRLFVAERRRSRLLDRHSSAASIEHMHWSDFERLVGEAFRRWGYRIEETGLGGADGGVDLRLRKHGQLTLVQCKHWQSRSVGAPYVREMLGLMVHHQAHAIAIVTSGTFTRQAWAFAKGKPIELIDGHKLAKMIQAVQRH
jgi:restriction system protein